VNFLKIISFNNIYYFETIFIKINNKADIYTWDWRKSYQKEGRICVITRGEETSMRASSVEKNNEYEEKRRLVVFDFTVEIGVARKRPFEAKEDLFFLLRLTVYIATFFQT